jgi:hypothetical protein
MCRQFLLCCERWFAVPTAASFSAIVIVSRLMMLALQQEEE